MARLDLTLARIEDGPVTPVEGGHQLSASVVAPRVDGDRLTEFVTLALVEVTYAGWAREDFERANLRLQRAARDRLRELALEALRAD